MKIIVSNEFFKKHIFSALSPCIRNFVIFRDTTGQIEYSFSKFRHGYGFLNFYDKRKMKIKCK